VKSDWKRGVFGFYFTSFFYETGFHS